MCYYGDRPALLRQQFKRAGSTLNCSAAFCLPLMKLKARLKECLMLQLTDAQS